MANLTKDARLIKENPKATPYELLKLGLSEAKYQELLAEEPKPEPKNVKEAEKVAAKVQPSEKLIPEIKPSARALPKLTPHTGILTEQARVKGPDGKITPMLRARAIKFTRKNPTYKIID